MKKIVLLGSSLLLALTLAGCANSSSNKEAHKDVSSKIEKKVSHKQSDYFKNDNIKTKNISLTINQKDLIKFNNREDLRLLFTIKNETNSAIDNLMNNKIIKASQKINNKDVQLPVVNESMSDSTIEKTNKNDHVEAQSSAQSVMYFKVRDINQPVILTAYDKHGKKIGTETIQLNKIKTINLNNQSSSVQQQNSDSNSQQQTAQQNVNNQQQVNAQQNQQQAPQPIKNNQQPVNMQQNNQQQYTEQGHYPTWKEGNVYYAKLPDGTIMKQTFADGDDPGTYQGNPEVQRETAQLQDQWNKEHGIN